MLQCEGVYCCGIQASWSARFCNVCNVRGFCRSRAKKKTYLQALQRHCTAVNARLHRINGMRRQLQALPWGVETGPCVHPA